MSTLIVGCGYLGRRVGRLLFARGEHVLGTVRTPEKAAPLTAFGIEPILADVLDPATLDHLPQTRRVVYCVGFDRSKGVPMRTVYVDGVRNVLDRLGRVPEVFVYTSSTGVYGRNDGEWVRLVIWGKKNRTAPAGGVVDECDLRDCEIVIPT